MHVIKSSSLILASMLGIVLTGACAIASADGGDRERAQMLQMQQQLQRVQSDNAALVREKGSLQDQVKEIDKVKAGAARTAKELAAKKVEIDAALKDSARLQGELDALRRHSEEQLEQWKKALAQRDETIVAAVAEKRKLDEQVALLSARLKVQTARGDHCELKHGQAMEVGKSLVDAYEENRMRLCEPVTGIWKLREEERIQSFRERLFEARLDVPSPPPAGTGAQSAVPSAGAALEAH